MIVGFHTRTRVEMFRTEEKILQALDRREQLGDVNWFQR